MSEGGEQSGNLLWTDEEVQELAGELEQACIEEKNKAVDQAVKTAVIPLLAENETLIEQNDLLAGIIEDEKYSNIKTGIITGVISFCAGYLLCRLFNEHRVQWSIYTGGL